MVEDISWCCALILLLFWLFLIQNTFLLLVYYIYYISSSAHQNWMRTLIKCKVCWQKNINWKEIIINLRSENMKKQQDSKKHTSNLIWKKWTYNLSVCFLFLVFWSTKQIKGQTHIHTQKYEYWIDMTRWNEDEYAESFFFVWSESVDWQHIN